MQRYQEKRAKRSCRDVAMRCSNLDLDSQTRRNCGFAPINQRARRRGSSYVRALRRGRKWRWVVQHALHNLFLLCKPGPKRGGLEPPVILLIHDNRSKTNNSPFIEFCSFACWLEREDTPMRLKRGEKVRVVEWLQTQRSMTVLDIRWCRGRGRRNDRWYCCSGCGLRSGCRSWQQWSWQGRIGWWRWC